MAVKTSFNWVEKEQLKRCQSSYVMVARPKKYNFAASLASTGTIRMFFESLMDEPEPILNSDNVEFMRSNYIAFDKYQHPDFLPDFYEVDSYDMERRATECTNFYRNKLAVFMPVYKIGNEGASYKNMEIIDMVDDRGGVYFVPVPRIEMDNRRFEKQLRSQEYFVIEGFDSQLVPGTDIVICGDYAYRFRDRKAYESFLRGSEQRYEAWKYNDHGEIVKVRISEFEGYENFIIDGIKSMCLVEDVFVQMIMNSQNYVSIDEVEVKDSFDEIELDLDSAEESLIDVVDIEDISASEEVSVSNAEINFLNGLSQLTKANNLVYEYKDLVNFHTSVKTNPLTILSGMSGTGKTQLAYNYARMLDLSEDNNTLLFMPVSPAYSDPGDILGFLNPMTNEYVPAETGLVDFLIHADNNKDRMHMVIFDEMNLSQVEYWFSPFISILEKDMGDRFLKLYNAAAPGDKNGENRKRYPSRIKIADNVIFVGTVNVDETTKDFSDRLLDRTFVINLKKIGFKDVYERLNMKSEEKVDISSAQCGDASVFMTWNKKYSRNHLDAFTDHREELAFLDDFSELLSTSIHSDGISHRVLRNIGYFLLNLPVDGKGPVIERSEAFDIIVNQTVMQKIRGTESQLSSLIGGGTDGFGLSNGSSLIALLDKYESVSKFENVRRTISKKAEDLRVNGYTN